MSMIRKLLATAFIALLLSSCKSENTSLTYFEDLKEQKDGSFELPDYSVKLQPDDELLITVNSSEPRAVQYYNMPLVNPAQRDILLANTNPQLQTYIIDKEGNINFPTLGSIHIAGMSIEDATTFLNEKVREDVTDAIVRLELLNFNVNVLGEVKAPGRYKVTNRKITVLDALAMAGDMTEFGLRENVTVIREENGKLVYHHINLNNSEVFASPYYYLQQNDVVYVEPNKAQQDASKYNKNNTYKVSVISTIVSACSVVVSLIIALTVK